jgi:4-hydroxy-tetrahydrodipicolinate reductase
MGRALLRVIQERREDQIVGALAAPDVPEQGRDVGEVAGIGHVGVAVTADLAVGLLGADVAIDFSAAPAVERLCRAVKRAKVALVSGTTAIDEAGQAALADAASVVPVLWSPNMSLGVELLARLSRMAAVAFGDDYDIEIVETHHQKKADAPSGTALRLAESVREARPDLSAKHGRQGIVGARKRNELGILSLRGGDIIGDHSVHFFGPGERLELTHRATDRDLFARGALRAARWLVGKKPGRYALGDLFG